MSLRINKWKNYKTDWVLRTKTIYLFFHLILLIIVLDVKMLIFANIIERVILRDIIHILLTLVLYPK